MKKGLLTLIVGLAVSMPAMAQESITERLAKIEQNNNSIMSMQAAQKATMDNIQADVAAIRAELSAVKKASGVKVAPVSNWAGDAQFSATAPAASSWGSNSQMMTFSSGAGACANGQCGVSSSGRVGLFGRRR